MHLDQKYHTKLSNNGEKMTLTRSLNILKLDIQGSLPCSKRKESTLGHILHSL